MPEESSRLQKWRGRRISFLAGVALCTRGVQGTRVLVDPYIPGTALIGRSVGGVASGGLTGMALLSSRRR